MQIHTDKIEAVSRRGRDQRLSAVPIARARSGNLRTGFCFGRPVMSERLVPCEQNVGLFVRGRDAAGGD